MPIEDDETRRVTKRDAEGPTEDLSRAAQTGLIVGVLLLMGTVALLIWNAQPDPTDPFDHCRSWTGTYEKKCVDSMYATYRSQGQWWVVKPD